jgi:hypothetical protein
MLHVKNKNKNKNTTTYCLVRTSLDGVPSFITSYYYYFHVQVFEHEHVPLR